MRLTPLIALSAAAMSLVSIARAQDRIETVRVTFRSGGDDLRDHSVLEGYLVGPGGRVGDQFGFTNLPANTSKTVTINLPGNLPPMTLDDVRRLSLVLVFHGNPNRKIDDYDNWDLARLRISAHRRCASDLTLAYAVGGPWQRFSGENRTARLPVSVSPGDSGVSTTSLRVRVVTGDDDLRRGAQAQILLSLRDGRTMGAYPLNNGANLAAGSTRSMNVTLPEPVTLGEIVAVTFFFDGAGRNFGETYDNWDVSEVQVFNPAWCPADVLKDVYGNPWWRATRLSRDRTIPLSP